MNEESRRTVEIRRNSTWAQDRSDAQRRRGSEALAPCSVTKNVKVIFEEFKSLYEERLKRLKTGTEGCTQEEMLQVGAIVFCHSFFNPLVMLLCTKHGGKTTAPTIQPSRNGKIAFFKACAIPIGLPPLPTILTLIYTHLSDRK